MLRRTVLAAAPFAALSACRRAAPDAPSVGGPFRLVDQDGRAVDESILKGRWTAVFFGYTFCPDVCPATLQSLAAARAALGARADRLGVVFISVDPARDTPARLKAYLSDPDFPKGAIGLTGSADAVAAAARAYGVYFRRAGDGPSYTVDHSAVVYLMDPDGRFRAPLAFGLSPTQMRDAIASAMDGRGG